jgi:alpha-ketoglutarate-dependent taurine dioxygenase
MKISKIPGLGRFGIFIDDLDFNHITDEEWMEIGQLHLKNLVTIIRNTNVSLTEYERRMLQWGNPRAIHIAKLAKKYNLKDTDLGELISNDVVNNVPVALEDKNWMLTVAHIVATEVSSTSSLLRVSGKRDQEGNPMGMFAEGELLWHSNESGQIDFTPGVSLLGSEGVVGSATGFATTSDWYESQTESFRSELDDMVICHEFTPGKINPGLPADQDQLMYKNMCPDPVEIPLVIQSPLGIKGLHYSVNTIKSIKGMSETESQQMFDRINAGVFSKENIYDHWYAQDNDLCLFDNSITQHRRLGGITNRLAYRLQHDYSNLTAPINPYFQEPYISQYKQMKDEHDNMD